MHLVFSHFNFMNKSIISTYLESFGWTVSILNSRLDIFYFWPTELTNFVPFLTNGMSHDPQHDWYTFVCDNFMYASIISTYLGSLGWTVSIFNSKLGILYFWPTEFTKFVLFLANEMPKAPNMIGKKFFVILLCVHQLYLPIWGV